MKQLSSIDAQMLFVETANTPNHIAPVNIYDPSTAPGGKMRFKSVIEYVQNRLPQASIFRRKLIRVPFGLDEPYWIEDPDFDLEFHIRHIALPEPGDWRQLCILLARLGSIPLDMNRPPWEMTVIGGLDNVEGVPPGSFAIFYKIHHCAIDGMGGLDLMNVLHDLEANKHSEVSIDSWQPDTIPSAWKLLRKATLNNATRPVKMVQKIGKFLPGAFRASRQKIERPPSRLPVTRFNKAPSPHRVYDRLQIPLADIKSIRQAIGNATVNDISLALVSGGLRNYLKAKGELPEESLVALVPISTRGKGEEGSGGNLVAMLSASLCTNIEDPIERLKGIQNSMGQTKAYAEAVGARQLTEIATTIPGRLQGMAARASASVENMLGTRLMSNTLVTNVPGPQQPLYFNGAQCVDMFGMAPLGPNMGLVHGIGSYCGSMSLNVCACRTQLPDPDFYIKCLQEALEELKQAAAQ